MIAINSSGSRSRNSAAFESFDPLADEPSLTTFSFFFDSTPMSLLYAFSRAIHALRTLSAVTSSASGIAFTEAVVTMKFASPIQRGTT